ncbi:hypothetical protein ET495_10055 [Xylanimonas allomyrinae]|uniref:Uncharacterized protein n=1 Tax=Xylanimonas allomyrinae TaxID=2509459 RepID=A0A4P6EP50_9MICO|nr:hypothetical protein [Xylanimonas allomyrinae]QAY63533.1 hypothetical protein ET495_10055 [Xylanimonas allomyrinae]
MARPTAIPQELWDAARVGYVADGTRLAVARDPQTPLELIRVMADREAAGWKGNPLVTEAIAKRLASSDPGYVPVPVTQSKPQAAWESLSSAPEAVRKWIADRLKQVFAPSSAAPVLSVEEQAALDAEIAEWANERIDPSSASLDQDIKAATTASSPTSPLELSEYRFKSAAKRAGHTFEFVDWSDYDTPADVANFLPLYMAACSCEQDWREDVAPVGSKTEIRRSALAAWKSHVMDDPWADFKLDPVLVKSVVAGGLPSLGKRS